MKKLLTLTIVVLLASNIFAQNGVVISTDQNATTDPSAILDVQSTNKGVLIPRMTESDRNNILSPANGLTIYQTDNYSGFYYYNGTTTSWQKMSYFIDNGSQILLATGDEVGTNDAKSIFIKAGSNTNTATNTNGGSIIFQPGTGQGTGVDGSIILQSDKNYVGVFDNTGTGGMGGIEFADVSFNIISPLRPTLMLKSTSNTQQTTIVLSANTTEARDLHINHTSDGNTSFFQYRNDDPPGDIMTFYNNGSIFMNNKIGIGASYRTDASVFVQSTETWTMILAKSAGEGASNLLLTTGHSGTNSQVFAIRSNDSNFGGTGTDTEFFITNTGNVCADGSYWGASYETGSADFAEYMENEEELVAGDVVGLNKQTGKVRKYQPGDMFAGIVSEMPAFVGNSTDYTQNNPNYTLVGISGQLTFDETQVTINGRIIETKDGLEIGVLLNNGKVFIR